MIIELPSSFKGRQIAEAFLSAGTFEESKNRKFKATKQENNFQCRPVAPFSIEARDCTLQCRLFIKQKKFLQWGEKKWFQSGELVFWTEAIVFEKVYTEFELLFRYRYDADQGGFCSSVESPSDPKFEVIRPTFQRFLLGFYASISKNS